MRHEPSAREVAASALFEVEASGQLVMAGHEFRPHLSSCPKCRSLVVTIEVNGSPEGIVLDPPRHWVSMFWNALDDATFWALTPQDFSGSGDSGLHRCVLRIAGRDYFPSAN